MIAYRCIALSPRLEVVEDFPASIDCLTVQQFLDKPKY